MSAARKECENKESIPNLSPHGGFLEDIRETCVLKRRFSLFVLLWLFSKLLKRFRRENGEVEVFSSPFILDVAKEQPHGSKTASEQGQFPGRSSSVSSWWAWVAVHRVTSGMFPDPGERCTPASPASCLPAAPQVQYNQNCVFWWIFKKSGFIKALQRCFGETSEGAPLASNKVHFILKVYNYRKDI